MIHSRVEQAFRPAEEGKGLTALAPGEFCAGTGTAYLCGGSRCVPIAVGMQG